MSSWSMVSLSDLGQVSRGKSKHRPRNDASLYGGDYPFIQTGDVKEANFYINNYSQTYNEKGLKQSKLWGKDTLCITIAANIAESALLSFPACFPDSIVGFTPYEGVSDVRYVKYLLDNYKAEFQKRSKGATQDNLSVDKINALKVKVADYPSQIRIANLISTYDYLIEINLRRIRIVEEITQRLYTKWFVKFKFPGHENIRMIDSESIFRRIPEGWSVIKIGNILKPSSKTLKIKKSDYLNEGKYPIVDQGSDFISGRTNNKNALLDPGVIVFGDHTRVFKYCNFEFARGADGTQILDSKNKDSLPNILLYYMAMNAGLKDYKYARHFKFLKDLKIILPNSKVSSAFVNIVENYYLLVSSFRLQNELLMKSRNLLIENLITGKKILKQ